MLLSTQKAIRVLKTHLNIPIPNVNGSIIPQHPAVEDEWSEEEEYEPGEILLLSEEYVVLHVEVEKRAARVDFQSLFGAPERNPYHYPDLTL